MQTLVAMVQPLRAATLPVATRAVPSSPTSASVRLPTLAATLAVSVVRLPPVMLKVVTVATTAWAVTRILALLATPRVVMFVTARTFLAVRTTVLAAALVASLAAVLEARPVLLAVVLLLPLVLLPPTVALRLVSIQVSVSRLLSDSYRVAPPPPAFRNGGGNAFSGATGSTRGGDVINNADDGADITNTAGANAPGAGGDSTSGSAEGGDA